MMTCNIHFGDIDFLFIHFKEYLFRLVPPQSEICFGAKAKHPEISPSHNFNLSEFVRPLGIQSK